MNRWQWNLALASVVVSVEFGGSDGWQLRQRKGRCGRRLIDVPEEMVSDLRNKAAFFNNRAIKTEASLVQSRYDILAEIETLGLKKVTKLDVTEVNGFISKTCGWKRSIFWDLPY
nr:uncharacterized protein LOC109158407 [Ipomoea batatas]